MESASGTQSKPTNAMDGSGACSATEIADVKKVADVTRTTKETDITTVKDVTMRENITTDMPPEAAEVVKAIIVEVTAAAVSAASGVSATGLMQTDVSPSTRVAIDVNKPCTDSSPSDVTDDAATATNVTIDADVKAVDTGVTPVVKMDTDVTASVTSDKDITEPVTTDKDKIEPVTADTDITDKDITDPVTANKDITEPVTTDTDITKPIITDKDTTEPVTVDKDNTACVTADKNITEPATADTDTTDHVTADKDITEPVTADKDITEPVTTDTDITKPIITDKDTTEPVTADKDNTAHVTADKNITEPATADTDTTDHVTADKDITEPVTADKDITEPVTAKKDIAEPIAADKDIAEPDTADKDITEPVTADKDITEPVTAKKDIAEPITADKDIAEPDTADKDIAKPVTTDRDIAKPVTTDKDIAKPVTTDKEITEPITADTDIIEPITADKDIAEPVTADKDIAEPVTADKDIAEPITADNDIAEPITADKDIAANDTSMDCSNLSLPNFLESKSSAMSSVENSKELRLVHGIPAEQKVSSSMDEKLGPASELNMQRPFQNIGMSKNSSFASDVGKYLESGIQGVSSTRSTPPELPSSSSSKDLILMMSAKDAMSTPDDSLQESRNLDNIEIVQLIEDTTSVSTSMDVDRDASMTEEKEQFGVDISTAPAADEQSAAADTTPSPTDITPSAAEDSMLSKDSVDKSELKIEDKQASTNSSSAEIVPEESCKSEASGNVDPEGDVEMAEEKQSEASGVAEKQGTDAEGSEKGDDAEKADKKSKSAKKRRPGITAEIEEEDNEDHTMPAGKLIEYQWPQEKGSEWYMLQEQVSEYLDIVSFKRKYPDLQRRPVEVNEKLHLLESNIAVSEMQCDLGLTALKSDQVHELMARDYPDKFKEYAVVLQARERQKITDHHKGYELPTIDKTKLNVYMKKAVKSAAEYNSMFMKEKREERRAYFDLQTNEVHYPRQQKLVLPKEVTEVGSYPVTLIPGQFQDYYKKYTSQELKYFPMNTVLYNPPRPLKSLYPDPNQPSEEETEEEKEEAKSGSSGKGENDSSSSSSSSGSSSDSSDSEKDGATSGDSDQPLKAPTPKSTRKPRTKASKPAWEVTSPSLARLTPGKEPNVPCNICKGGADKNRAGKQEDLVKCSECNRYAHPSCLDLAVEMVPVIKTYPWQCMECKTCVKCMEPFDEDQMMFCDHCDRGYHTYCVGVRSIPMGRWECPSCHQEEPPKPKRVRRR
ncbi:PHD finger protein 10 [Lamellibrachia satsuma]|nr:PHD finger protein 10 [Lamellibrachia satsuma]